MELEDEYSYSKQIGIQFCDWVGEQPQRDCESGKFIIKGNSRMAIGVRNFFYQCFKGYWDSENQRFQFGTHPQGVIYNEARHVIGVGENSSLHTGNEVNIAESNWTSIFKEKAVDFLLEQHSPTTMRVLWQMQSS